MRDFLDLAAARASGELKGTVSSTKVTSGPVMSTRLGLEVVVLMSTGIVASGEITGSISWKVSEHLC